MHEVMNVEFVFVYLHHSRIDKYYLFHWFLKLWRRKKIWMKLFVKFLPRLDAPRCGLGLFEPVPRKVNSILNRKMISDCVEICHHYHLHEWNIQIKMSLVEHLIFKDLSNQVNKPSGKHLFSGERERKKIHFILKTKKKSNLSRRKHLFVFPN
jgi:hypothetical protein